MLWREQLRRLAKLAVTGGLYHSGELGRVRRKQMRGRALILMYYCKCDRRDMPRDAGPIALDCVNMCSSAAGREPLLVARILGF